MQQRKMYFVIHSGGFRISFKLSTRSLGDSNEDQITERGVETSETGGAQRSRRPGKRVGDWRAAEARANS